MTTCFADWLSHGPTKRGAPTSHLHSGGHAYLCAVMDCHSRNVLGWAASNAMEPGLCLEALDNALPATGSVPEVFIADPGCKFTSALAL